MSTRRSLMLLVIPALVAWVDEMDLYDRVSLSERIAWVRIENKEPIHVRGDDRDEICGYVYSASVVKPLKGDAQPFAFFSEYDSTQDGGRRDYLVVANRWTEEGLAVVRRSHSEVHSGRELELALCGLGSAQFLSQTGPRDMMVPLVVGAEPDRVLGLRRKQNLLGRGEFRAQEVEIDGVKTSVVGWSDIEDTIRRCQKND